jgi:hypothetical protein
MHTLQLVSFSDSVDNCSTSVRDCLCKLTQSSAGVLLSVVQLVQFAFVEPQSMHHKYES